jgi:hypothetical protein
MASLNAPNAARYSTVIMTISADEAKMKASKLRVPAPGEYVRVPSIEVLHFFLMMNHLKVAGWRGDYLVVSPLSQYSETFPQMEEHNLGEEYREQEGKHE